MDRLHKRMKLILYKMPKKMILLEEGLTFAGACGII